MRILLACLGLLSAGCVLPPSNNSVRDEPPAAAPATKAPAPTRLPGEVRVRLAAHEGKSSLRVDGSSEGPVELRVRGAQVESSSGEALRRYELRPAPGFSGLSIGERTYAGRLVVEAQAGGLRVTNVVPLEAYVEGVVAAELVMWSALPGAIGAQAVAARSYVVGTLAHRGRRGEEVFVWDDTRDQAYLGMFLPPPSARGAEVAERLRNGVRGSKGQLLMQADVLVDVRFHASCGGHTANSKDVFPEARGLATRGVACAPCARLAQSTGPERDKVVWAWVADAAALSKLAGELQIGSRVLSYQLVRADAHGRWLEVELVGDAGRTRIEADELRRRLGPTRWKSTRVTGTSPLPRNTIADDLHVEGRGRGHGVGLCQVGAQEWAQAGWNGERILLHYYPDARIATLPPASAAGAARP